MKSKLVLFFVIITFVVSGCASVTKDQIVAENIATKERRVIPNAKEILTESKRILKGKRCQQKQIK